MSSCPFYGCRWRENSSVLVVVDGNECGLDVEAHGACAMEEAGFLRDYFSCPVVKLMRPLMKAGRWQITFKSPGKRLVTLAQWEDSRS